MIFDHEKLRVYQLSLDFNECVGNLLDLIKPKIAVCDHLDDASSSIWLNIAEGNGKFTSKDRCKYFDIARGSALECAASIDILLRRKKIRKEDSILGKQMLLEIVPMIVGLIKSNSDRGFEPDEGYKSDDEIE